MIIGLFSLKPTIYPFLRDIGNQVYGAGDLGAGDHSKSSKHLSRLCRAWTDPLDYVQSNKIGGLGEDTAIKKAIKKAKRSFVKKTCVLTYNPVVKNL